MMKYIALLLCIGLLINSNQQAHKKSENALPDETTVEATKSEEKTTVAESSAEVTTTVETKEEPTSSAAASKYPEMEKEILKLINEYRAMEGLAPLKMEYAYYECAYIRANECLEYWSHTRPDGRRSYTVYYDLDLIDGIKMLTENLAKNFKTTEQVMEKLMASPAHRSAILCENYTHVTICIIDVEGYDGLYAMSQLFTQKD